MEGEEFIVLLPQTEKLGAMVLAEKLRTTIEAADQALYQAKTNGRNQTGMA